MNYYKFYIFVTLQINLPHSLFHQEQMAITSKTHNVESTRTPNKTQWSGILE